MGWLTESDDAKNRVADAISLALFIVPFFGLVYALLAITGLVSSLNFLSSYMELLFVAAWVLVAAGMYLRRRDKRVVNLLYLVLYHIFMATYIIASVEVGSSFVYLWVILALVTHLYVGFRGLMFSLVGLFATQMATVAVNGNIEIVASSIVATLVIVTVTVLSEAISTHDKVDKSRYDNTLHLASMQHDRLLTVINTLVSSVIVTGTEGSVSVYNSATLNLLDTNRELSRQSIDVVLPVENKNGQRIMISELLKQTKTVLTRDDLYLPEGSERLRLEVTISPIRSGYTKHPRETSTGGYVLIARDVTRAKSLEEEKDEFISVVSHELRTPITVVEGTISNVLAMIDKKAITKGKQKEAIQMAHNQVVFLSKMINDLSTLSRAERGIGDEKKHIEVPSLMRELFTEYGAVAKKKKLQLNLDMPSNVDAVISSELYLKELLQNLITNAIKYTQDGSVTISATQEKQTITIAIKDTGIGIGKADQARILERFFRSEDYRTRETGGTGLGLYVADKLARILGTRIRLRSRLNHGSTFWIELEAVDSE